jgi:hypothetical protein
MSTNFKSVDLSMQKKIDRSADRQIDRFDFLGHSRKHATFLLVICMNFVKRNGPSTYVIEETSFVKMKVDMRVWPECSHACSQRAQLLGVTPHELRGQKLAEILIFYVGQKISWHIYAPIGLTKLLRCVSTPSRKKRKRTREINFGGYYRYCGVGFYVGWACV